MNKNAIKDYCRDFERLEKFTPGPWSTARDKRGRYNACECTVIAAPAFNPYNPYIEDLYICSTQAGIGTPEEKKANALLIAKAPKMYDLLKKIRESIVEGDPEFLQELDQILKEARGEE